MLSSPAGRPFSTTPASIPKRAISPSPCITRSKPLGITSSSNGSPARTAAGAIVSAAQAAREWNRKLFGLFGGKGGNFEVPPGGKIAPGGRGSSRGRGRIFAGEGDGGGARLSRPRP